MSTCGFALFETPIGACGIAWSEAGLLATSVARMPTRSGVRASFARRYPALAEAAMPPADRGHCRSDRTAPRRASGSTMPMWRLDQDGVGAWELDVYRAALAIPFGETRTYGELARALGRPEAAQAVGQALGRNPWPIVIPCHRILAADGRTGGFSAPGGAATKLRLLEIEGALAPESLPLFASHRRLDGAPPRSAARAGRRSEAAPPAPRDHAALSASAGTGKTHVLTARVLRLLLAGVDPASILCLTFTKAGAAEMAERIHARLAHWVRAEGRAISRARSVRARRDASTRRLGERARTLFARVLDATGGGLRIQTIHAFAQSLLGGLSGRGGARARLPAAGGARGAAARRATLAEMLVRAEQRGRSAAWSATSRR